MFDKKGEGFIGSNKLKEFLYYLGHPFGTGSSGVKEFLAWIKITEIATFDKTNKIYFHNVLFELIKNAIFIETIEFETSDIVNSRKIQRFKATIYSIMKFEAKEIVELPFYRRNDLLSTTNLIYKRDNFNSSLEKRHGFFVKAKHAWAIRKLTKFFRLYVL